MSVLIAKNLKKKFKDFVAVDNLSLELAEGEILGILGPNGAGKTTTIQMLLGLLTPTVGAIEYFNKSLKKHRAEIMEYVNFSSTYTNLPWYLTVRENLRWVSNMFRIKDREQRIEKIIEIFKMDDVAGKIMADLSAGQLTRVSLAKAFINFPKVLLLDEPTASLDVEIAKRVRELILEQRLKYKTSVIITSHNMVEVEELCDRVIVINHGKIIADDTPQNLIRSIKISHIELLINEGIEETTSYLDNQKIRHRDHGYYIYVDIQSDSIPGFLQHLVEQRVSYNEISIERPSLEDYFLQVIGKGERDETV